MITYFDVNTKTVVSAPSCYGVIDQSIGGQLARKRLPFADGRTRRGMTDINRTRDAIAGLLKAHIKGEAYKDFAGFTFR